MQNSPDPHVFISINAQKMLFKDVYQRRHIEACGVLLGYTDQQGNWHIEQVQPLRNVFSSPVYFEFAPEDLLEVELNHPGAIVGVYHSHPTGYNAASATDRSNMKRVNVEEQIPWVWLIVRGPFSTLLQPEQQQAQSALIAYHHYERSGLQQIKLHFEE
ncbi:MAG: hypothetical protein NVS4B7_05400 [Ktedonobacteraceae bacterium]